MYMIWGKHVRLTTNGAFGDKGSVDVDEDEDEETPFFNSLQNDCTCQKGILYNQNILK